MNTLRSLWVGDTPGSRRIGLAVVILAALFIRLAALAVAYPAPGDVVHYVQAAVEIARGAWDAWPTVFSAGPLLLASLAEHAGLPSALVLQLLSLVCGVLATAGFTLLAYRVMGRWACGLVTGGFVATNPSLVYYSVTGYSEIPYLAVLSLAGLLIYNWLARDDRFAVRSVAAFAALGLAAYFRTDEAHALALSVAAVGVLVGLWRKSAKRVFSVVPGLLTFAAAVLPIYLITYSAIGEFAPGTKYASIVTGNAVYDSKLYNSLRKPWESELTRIQEEGVAAYVWEHKGDFARRWLGNFARSIRAVNEELFAGAFRAGAGWFFSVLVAGLFMAWRVRRLSAWAYCVVFILTPIALISLFMCQPRYLLQTLPFAFILVSDLAVEGIDRIRGNAASVCVAALLAFYFFAKTAVWAVDYTAETGWYFRNGQRAGEALRAFGTDDDVVMTQQYCVTLHFHDRHPERLATLPYGSLEETEAYAKERNVSLIAISDSQFPHWPINALFHGAPPPPNWTVLKELTFERNSPFYGPIQEKYLLLRRTAEGNLR